MGYDLPLINFNRALEPLPNRGVNPENTSHLSVPADSRTDLFVEPKLQAGFTVRNLVTLKALYALGRRSKWKLRAITDGKTLSFVCPKVLHLIRYRLYSHIQTKVSNVCHCY